MNSSMPKIVKMSIAWSSRLPIMRVVDYSIGRVCSAGEPDMYEAAIKVHKCI